ncbi:Cys-Gln thioester bond-forming surface protein (plasmid) [Embleya sp. NBC_00888]|uniref:Cys-Gln thioester bond-forming surface protein n=1 Tax=Embleya sp. NBC_00888 TaxID=2975960 RepID=UPI002F912DF0|nr:Cys-Gln thioester bond-forming surface protein [Embleya sp. NBC_00888]
MFRIQRVVSRAGSIGVATGLTAVTVVGLSPAAHADADAAVRFRGHVADTRSSVLLQGDSQPTTTELMILGTRKGAPEVLVYCIDLETNLRPVDYREGTWADSWLTDSAKVARINWVLNHSYPKVTDLTALGTAAGLPQGRKLSADEAVAATQAAIWHYSNGFDVSKWNNEDVLDLYGFLTGGADRGRSDEPGASLELSPGTKSGKDGDAPGVGPVTVRTTSTEPVTVGFGAPTPAGATLVGRDGNPITSATNGTDLFVKVPRTGKPGEARITATTKAGVDVGRVFLGKDRKHTQTLITAGSRPLPVDASATVRWSPEAVPVPSSRAKEECVEGGVTVTLKNTGDAPADFTVDGTKTTVPPGASKTHFVKVAEDRDYNIKVTGPAGYAKTHNGNLDCVATPPAPPTTTPPKVPPTTTRSTPPAVPPTTTRPTTSAPTRPATVPATTASSTAPPTSVRPTTPATSKPPIGTPSNTTPPSSSASASAPEPTTPPSSAPPKPIVEPGTDDQPLTVPWLPVAPVGDPKDLAETGGDDSTVVIVTAAAVALLTTGGGALYLNKRRGRPRA